MSTTLSSNGNSGVAILDRVIQADDATMSPDTARTFLSFKFPKSDERRMNQLAAKARKGTLTNHEQFEAEQYNIVSHLVALLQAKARGALQNQRVDAEPE